MSYDFSPPYQNNSPIYIYSHSKPHFPNPNHSRTPPTMCEYLQQQQGPPKRQPPDSHYDVVHKKLRPAGLHHQEEDQDVMAWLSLHDETVTELSELLDSPSPGQHQFNFKVKFIDDPYTTPVIFQSSSAYVTINGNEESCGSSFSDSDSTVMASVDRGSFRGAFGKLNADGGGAWGPDAAAAAPGWMWMEGSDYVEGIFVKSLSGYCDLFGSPPPPPSSGYYYEDEDVDGDGDGDDEMWVNFLGEDLFGGA